MSEQLPGSCLGTIYLPDSQGAIAWAGIYRNKDRGIVISSPESLSRERNYDSVQFIAIPGELSWQSALPALPAAVAIEALVRSDARLGEGLLVIGSSPWARAFILAGELLSLAPLLWVVEKDAEEMIRGDLPAGCELLAGDQGVITDRLKLITGNQGFPLVANISGGFDLFKMALGAGMVRGRLLLLGPSSGDTPLDLFTTLHLKNLSITGLWKKIPPGETLKAAIVNGPLKLAAKISPEQSNFLCNIAEDNHPLKRDGQPGEKFLVDLGNGRGRGNN